MIEQVVVVRGHGAAAAGPDCVEPWWRRGPENPAPAEACHVEAGSLDVTAAVEVTFQLQT